MIEKRTCPQCGEKNDSVSLYCWVCYFRFDSNPHKGLAENLAESTVPSIQNKHSQQNSNFSELMEFFKIVGMAIFTLSIFTVVATLSKDAQNFRNWLSLLYLLFLSGAVIWLFKLLTKKTEANVRSLWERIFIFIIFFMGIILLAVFLFLITCANFHL